MGEQIHVAGGDDALDRCFVADLEFVHASGNLNPMHMPGADVDGDGVPDTVAPSMWLASLITAVLGNILPGAGSLLLDQGQAFLGRAHVGDTLRVTVRVIEKLESPRVVFETEVAVVGREVIAKGRAEINAPTHRVVTPPAELPMLMLDEHDHFEHLVEQAAALGQLPTAVVCPDDANSLAGTILSMQRGLIAPILIGDKSRIESMAAQSSFDLTGLELIDEPNHKRAAARAVALVHEGRVRAIMKGNLHSDDLLGQVVKKEGGLRTSRRVSHVFVLDVPTMDHPLLVTDAAINIAPDLQTKADITQNAIDLAIACGVKQPLVGILSAVETVNFSIPSSMDAAILAKMAERGQIKGGLVDGPLAMDNAIDATAARIKKITSPVAGAAQILVVPNLEAGNMLAKQLTFVSRAQPAGIVLGAQVPVMLTSRADNDQARLASCALALLYAYYQEHGKSALSAPPSSLRGN